MFTSYKNILTSLTVGGVICAAHALPNEWNSPTPPAKPTQVLPLLNVEVKNDTKAITFINTNNDPFVYTKVYELKNADPYEIRPYLMAAIRARRINTNDTKVEAIKYMDGKGMLIVSAEQYRFDKLATGQSLDEIIAELDRPNLSSEAGRQFFLYYPKYFDSTTLATIVRRVGLTHANDPVELQGGIDTVRADTSLNALMFYSTPFSKKNIESILKEYDAPTTEALIEYKIYELDSEGDSNFGVDFQAWKNGPGADLFAAGARYSNGWDFTNNNVANNMVKKARSSVINFNPKWNSKYLDFLVAKSKASVITAGKIDIMNRATGSIQSVTRMPIIETGDTVAGYGASQTTVSQAMTISAWSADYTLSAIDQDKGWPLAITPANYPGEVVITKTTLNNRVYYTMSLDHSGASFVRSDGKNYGRIAKAYDVSVTYTDTSVVPPMTTTVDNYSNAYAYDIKKDNTRVTKQAEFGFFMSLTPEVNTESSIIKLDMKNTNLIGFTSSGAPRTSDTKLSTNLQVSSDGTTFYVGGLDKVAWNRSVSKVPYLGDIPFLGFVFSAENESIKKTQIVAVITVKSVNPDTKVDDAIKEEAEKIRAKAASHDLVKDKLAIESAYGFDQYWLDPDKD